MPETLKGTIERVTYHNRENGFAVLKVQVKGRRDMATVVGNLTSVTAGEYLDEQYEGEEALRLLSQSTRERVEDQAERAEREKLREEERKAEV